MASAPRRPPTRTGSGSRPPTSRFQEGSMNDRASAAPPPQFLGPEQLIDYESQFYTDPSSLYEARAQRHARPSSATAQLQAATTYRQFDAEDEAEDHRIMHKKSTGFFGRVRDVLFNRGGQQGDLRRKHSSLQEPLQPPPPRPDYRKTGWAQSEINFAQMVSNPRGAGDRPTKEEVEASYSQLMASGFFKSHAIQSTRHGPPRPVPAQQSSIRRVTPAHSIPNPPVRVSSINAPTRTSSASLMPPPKQSSTPKPRRSRDQPRGRAAAAQTAARNSLSSLSSLFTPSTQELRSKESRYTLRGRKRTRGDGEETPRTSTTDSHYSFASSTAYFAQPLKRVAKKLRKTPSSTSAQRPVEIIQAPPPQQPTTADCIVRLVPSVSTGGSLYPNERAVRMRSPSPQCCNERNDDIPHDRASPAPRRPRKTFSYKLTEPVRTRERRQTRAQKHDVSRDSRPRSKPSQRGSFEETIIHCDYDETDTATRRREWERERQAAAITTAMGPGAGVRSRRNDALQMLQAANRGMPSVPKAPERWHGSGKAYHLRDRGAWPSDGRISWCEKENVDSDGDVEMGVRKELHSHWYIGNAL
ncbi:hypothetical protein F4861DRAFT_212812 [Xylaria intraflava]|nr:hypothetical protein F4861DRAFT_212812 [Xylaria intraflava]